MPDRGTVVYLYDGTFEGMLCCVFASYTRREIPVDILCQDTPQLPLYPTRTIETTAPEAQRVFRSLDGKLGAEATDLLQRAFLSGSADKDMAVFRFIRLGYQVGPKVINLLGDESVSRVHKLALATWHEAHHMMGFLRFSDYDGRLVAIIEPRDRILHYMLPHFCERFNSESFLIYDKTHHQAAIYQPYEAHILEVEDFTPPPPGAAEVEFRRLWKGYFEHIAIQARCNPRCQMNFMPKRFWPQLTEMQDLPKIQHQPLSFTPPPTGAIMESKKGALPNGKNHAQEQPAADPPGDRGRAGAQHPRCPGSQRG